MKAALFVAFTLLGLLSQSQGGLLGGLTPVSENDNSAVVEEGFKNIKEYLIKHQEATNDGHKPTLAFSDRKVYKQVVAGLLYTYKFKLTYTYGCDETHGSNNLCQEKPPVTLNCTASVWQKPEANAPLEFAPGKEPKCQ